MLSNSEYCETLLNTMSGKWYPPGGHNLNQGRVFPITPSSNSRESRNKAEKNRRDKINSLITELATLVPMVARSAKRMDKTSILRLAATYLRIYHIFSALTKCKANGNFELPKHIDQNILDQLVCDQLGGFLLILSSNGKIVYVSNTVENILGHLQTDLMGQSLFNITMADDHERLRTYLTSEGAMETEWRKYFNIRLKRAGPRSESAVYEPVKLMGMHRHDHVNGDGMSSPGSSSSPEAGSTSSSLSNDILVFLVKVCRPEPLKEKLMEASKDEYITRHLIDGRIINCDQRISLIAGYMIDEVSGHSAFKYMHRDDVRWVMIALRQMYDRGESRGSSCYRLISRNGQFIYLRTFGYLEIDDQGTVESFVCVNTLVSEPEGQQMINEMKKRYAALINNTTLPNLMAASLSSSEDSLDLVEDPKMVDEAVTHLVRNLPSPGSDMRSTPSPQVYYENQDCSSTTESCSPNKQYHVKYKTVTIDNSSTTTIIRKSMKRPPSTDLNLASVVANANNLNNNKRQRITTSPQRCVSPYTKRAVITEITSPPDQSIYQHDQLLRTVRNKM